MDPMFGGFDESAAATPPESVVLSGGDELSVYESSFPSRVAAFLRFSPIVETAQAARRRGDWAADAYDIVTLCLAAIDFVVSRQGFEFEVTRAELLAMLTRLAELAAPDQPAAEHQAVANFVVEALLNDANRNAQFRYTTSDYSDTEVGHRHRDVPFALLIERDHPTRNENVLNATRDAINALIGGLDFDVEDEQVATELVLERQLARNAFDAALKSAERARLLSVAYADDLDRLLKQTRRDLRTVEQEWSDAVPERLDEARHHIRGNDSLPNALY